MYRGIMTDELCINATGHSVDITREFRGILPHWSALTPVFGNLFSTGYNMLSNAIIEYPIQMGCDVILCDVDEM